MKCKNCNCELEDNNISVCPSCGNKIQKDKFPVWIIVIIILVFSGLFTLPFIGIIAAMTIPTLLDNTDKAKNRIAFIKTLSTLNQALVMNEAINDKNYSFSDDVWTKAVKGNVNYTDIKDGIKLADGVEIKYEKLRDNCSLAPLSKDNIGASTACAKLTIDTNGFDNGLNKATAKKNGSYEIGDRFVVWMYSNVVELEKNSAEDGILNNLDRK